MTQISANTISKTQILEMHEQYCKDARELMRRKNQDYTGGSADPFANFRGSMALGVEPEIGLMIRMQDKFQRVKSFIANDGILAVQEEGIRDIIQDLINYSVLMGGLLIERQNKLPKWNITNDMNANLTFEAASKGHQVGGYGAFIAYVTTPFWYIPNGFAPRTAQETIKETDLYWDGEQWTNVPKTREFTGQVGTQRDTPIIYITGDTHEH